MRLRCGCGRNLADVTKPGSNPDWTRDGLVVTPRPNVQQLDFRPWHEANGRRSVGNLLPTDYDWHDRTYAWLCVCGTRSERRHERVSVAWEAHSGDSGRRVVVAVLDRDL